MTITNHIINIQTSAGQALEFVDLKKYPSAHLCLDDIESFVRKARRHIDHLQNVADFCPRPKGGN